MRRGWLLLIAAAAGCGGESAPAELPGSGGSAPSGCAQGELATADGTCCPLGSAPVDGACVAAGVPDDLPCPPGNVVHPREGCCEAGTVPEDDGTCRPAGVPSDGCAPGFDHDGHGCVVVLPADPCTGDTMAVPGDAACAPIMECGTSPWGMAPVGATTQYVDAAFTGSSDGSEGAPWTTIAQAYATAAPNAVIAIAAGTYAGGLALQGKPVALWGRCPSMVRIVATGNAEGATISATGTEIHGVSITSSFTGLTINSASDVVLEGVRLHDTGDVPLVLLDGASVTLRGSLIDGGRGGALVRGSHLEMERSVVRSPQSVAGFGAGIQVEDLGLSASLKLTNSVIDGAHNWGIHCSGSDLEVDGSVVRGTLDSDGPSKGIGAGIEILPSQVVPTSPSNATLTRSVIDDSAVAGVFVAGSSATFDAMTIRGTSAVGGSDLATAIAANAYPTTGAPADVTVTDSHLAQNVDVSAYVGGSTLALRGVRIDETIATPAGLGGAVVGLVASGAGPALTVEHCAIVDSQRAGVSLHGASASLEGVAIDGTTEGGDDGKANAFYLQRTTTLPATATLEGCRFAGSVEAGVFVAGGDVTLHNSQVLDTKAGGFGVGVAVAARDEPTSGMGATLDVLHTAIDGATGLGIGVATASQATIRATTIGGISATADALYGDAISLVGGSATVTQVRTADAARAAISSFAGQAELSGNALVCQAFDIHGQAIDGAEFSYDDRGGNGCGCNDPDGTCKLAGDVLVPPELP